MGQLDEQVALVVGASSGIGRATAIALAEAGARVALTARRAALLQAVAQSIRELGGWAVALPADAGQWTEVETVIEAALGEFGRLDLLVNAAGINRRDRALAVLAQNDWDEILKTNLTGAFYWTRAVLPAMRRQGRGLIVHVSSVSGLWPDMSGVAYQASKQGLIGLAHATMLEERANGIRVTLIYPGLCDTSILDNRPSPPTPAVRAQMMRPEDVAQAVTFVATLPERAYVAELVLMPSALQCVGQSW